MSLEERIPLVAGLWNSIAEDQRAVRLTVEQIAELDRRPDAFETDGFWFFSPAKLFPEYKEPQAFQGKVVDVHGRCYAPCA